MLPSHRSAVHASALPPFLLHLYSCACCSICSAIHPFIQNPPSSCYQSIYTLYGIVTQIPIQPFSHLSIYAKTYHNMQLGWLSIHQSPMYPSIYPCKHSPIFKYPFFYLPVHIFGHTLSFHSLKDHASTHLVTCTPTDSLMQTLTLQIHMHTPLTHSLCPIYEHSSFYLSRLLFTHSFLSFKQLKNKLQYDFQK